MVNYGVSRGCGTCKARHIKCDEARPVCRRCLKAKRTCLGYKDDTDLLFRGYHGSHPDSQTTGYPPRTTQDVGKSPGIVGLSPPNMIPEDLAAMSEFVQDYILKSTNRSLSRGYFDGLELLLDQPSNYPEVYGAVQIAALASYGNKTNNPKMVQRAALRYPNLLRSFQKILRDPRTCNSDEALITATLLGLYEIITTTEANPRAFTAHVQGVSAILCTRELPFDLLAGSSIFQVMNPLLLNKPEQSKVPAVLAPYVCTANDPTTKMLDNLFLMLRPILETSTMLLSNESSSKSDIQKLKQDAILLNKEFSLWEVSQPKGWEPRPLGVASREGDPSSWDVEDMTFWPGRIDSFYDQYVGGVWATYRKARLKLIDVIYQCINRLHSGHAEERDAPGIQNLRRESEEIANAICAAVPFQLIEDLEASLQKQGDSKDFVPGKAVGGLMQMYPLYVASTIPLVPLQQRSWMIGRLKWIGKYMGICQATELAYANPSEISHGSIADGHCLLWAGSLMQPPLITDDRE